VRTLEHPRRGLVGVATSVKAPLGTPQRPKCSPEKPRIQCLLNLSNSIVWAIKYVALRICSFQGAWTWLARIRFFSSVADRHSDAPIDRKPCPKPSSLHFIPFYPIFIDFSRCRSNLDFRFCCFVACFVFPRFLDVQSLPTLHHSSFRFISHIMHLVRGRKCLVEAIWKLAPRSCRDSKKSDFPSLLSQRPQLVSDVIFLCDF
jgi:hypothetical protein